MAIGDKLKKSLNYGKSESKEAYGEAKTEGKSLFGSGKRESKRAFSSAKSEGFSLFNRGRREGKESYIDIKGEGFSLLRKAKTEDIEAYRELKGEARSYADFGASVMEVISVGGIIGAIILILLSIWLYSVGLVPCIIGLFVGLIVLVAAITSYLTFDRIEKVL